MTKVIVIFRNIANTPNTHTHKQTENTCLFAYSQVYQNQVTWVAGTVHQAEKKKPLKKLRAFHLTKRGFNTLQIEKCLNTTITRLSVGPWHAQDKSTDVPRLTAGLRSDDQVVSQIYIANTHRLPTSITYHSNIPLIFISKSTAFLFLLSPHSLLSLLLLIMVHTREHILQLYHCLMYEWSSRRSRKTGSACTKDNQRR